MATVYGDVHDIGKNLVKTILSNNGYEVIDLGKQVPVEKIIEQAVELQADAIGLSALLVSTSQQMPLVVEALQERQLNLPVLIGGAAVNPDFAERISGQSYAGGVYYCKDAFDALKVLDTSQNKPSQIKATAQAQPPTLKPEPRTTAANKVQISPAPIPQPPFWGARVIPSLPLEALFSELNRSALYRISWGVKNARGEKWEKYQRDFDQRLAKMQAEALQSGWLNASAAYGFFPCRADGDDLLVFLTSPNGSREQLRFSFPRQSTGQGLCLSDFFVNGKSAQEDVAAFQIVTLGRKAVEYVHALQEQDGITSSFFSHGLAVQLTETAAKYMHNRIRRELGLKANQGKRYSWGYPAIPDLSQHELLFKLLPAGEKLGIQLTSAYQFIPEYTTAALILHHPQAVYFNIR